MSNKPVQFDDDNPEWSKDDFAHARGPESLSPAERAAFPKTRARGPQKTPTKEPVTLRLDRDVVEHFRATGSGWQSRINETLRESIRRTG